MNHQVTTQDLFVIIGQQTVEIDLLRRQLDQLSAMVKQLAPTKESAIGENGAQVVAEGVGELFKP